MQIGQSSATGLDRTAETARQHAKAPLPVCRCLNCGEAFTPARLAKAEFCGRACNSAWQNRRLRRGAMLYDLLMILRFQRSIASRFKIWRTMNRLASFFRDEDKAEREGRRSWRTIQSIRNERPDLWAE